MRSVPIVALLLAGSTPPAFAQDIEVLPFVGAGIEIASVPRASPDVCTSAQTLRGAGLEARAGLRVEKIAIAARGAFVARPESGSAPVCVPVPDGVHTERHFQTSDAPLHHALHFDGSIRYQPLSHVPLWLGPEIGYVRNQDSRYFGAVLGVRHRGLALEASLRSYSVGYRAITREWQDGLAVRDIDQTSARESNAGMALRLVVETR